MGVIHRLLAYLAVAGVAFGLGGSALGLLRRGHEAVADWIQAAVLSLLVVVGVGGLVVVVEDGRPADGLHFVYATIAIGIIPLARSFAGRASGRSAAILLLATFVVLAGLLYRLFATG